jgi:subtilisin family serine protease
MKSIKTIATATLAAILLYGCGATGSIISTPIENIDTSPLKISALTETEKHNWQHLDLEKDTIPGMGVDKAYAELIKNKKGKKVIVAVIDSGVDVDHEDLVNVVWTNKDEIPNNGKDDDKNGYIDDIHGWNFLGKGYNEQLEYVRILASGDTSNPDYERAQKEYEKEYDDYSSKKTQYDDFYEETKNVDLYLVRHLGKKDYTIEDVKAIKTEDQTLAQAKQIALFRMSSIGTDTMDGVLKAINKDLKTINDRVNYHLNKSYKGRKNGDDPNDMSNIFYGDGNVKPVLSSESHGTHVAGIIGAERNNGKGGNGIANNVEIMSIRAVPNGDEYDKDIALAIRYAVDNGAKVINFSFGKSYSPHSDWVRESIKYASDQDVVFVHAAGNDSKNLDVEPNFPDDNIDGKEISDTYIRVGSLAPKYGSSMVSDFSNYGKNNVDVFAPGSDIYSATPKNNYESLSGTSMASPAVAGVAALIRSYYPNLSAAQVKQIILDSGLAIKRKVIVGGDYSIIKPFADLSKSSKMVNAFNALIMAAKMSK